MPRGVKREPVEGEAELVVRAGESPSHTTLLDDSPSQPITYHLLDHGYGATPQHQIRREALTAPPKTSEVSFNKFSLIDYQSADGLLPLQVEVSSLSCNHLWFNEQRYLFLKSSLIAWKFNQVPTYLFVFMLITALVISQHNV